MDNYIEYESDDETVSFETDNETRVFKEEICDCPLCSREGRYGRIVVGDKSFYCSNARGKKPECGFILYKNNIEKLIRREITKDEVRELCEDGQFSADCIKISDDSRHYTGIFRLNPKDRYVGLKLNFPD